MKRRKLEFSPLHFYLLTAQFPVNCLSASSLDNGQHFHFSEQQRAGEEECWFLD